MDAEPWCGHGLTVRTGAGQRIPPHRERRLPGHGQPRIPLAGDPLADRRHYHLLGMASTRRRLGLKARMALSYLLATIGIVLFVELLVANVILPRFVSNAD